MNIEKTVNKYLYKSSVGNLPTDKQGNPIPALLFANAKNDDRFGDLYLFNNFGISGGDTLTSTSEITSHYTENNYSIQDHWAIPPRTYTLNGYIGELIYRPSEEWTNWLQENVTDYLAPLSIISPTVSSYVDSAINLTHQIEANYQKFSKYAENVMRSINSLGVGGSRPKTDTNAMQVYQTLEKLKQNRILVSVYTPYETLEDMAITNITVSGQDNTKYMTNLSITLQEYRTASTLVRQATKEEVTKLIESQASNEVNNGQVTTKEVYRSQLKTTYDSYKRRGNKISRKSSK